MPITTVKLGQLEYLKADGIAVPHCFTTRLGGVSRGHLASMNLGVSRGDTAETVGENYGILADALGFDSKNLVLTRQTHSDIIRVVTKADHLGVDHHVYPECDGLVTCDPGTALVIFTADCTPVLLHDPVTGAVGACHAGWRGTAADIAGKTVRAMVEHFGCKPENICAAIGPNIAQCCFQTDADVPQAMIDALGDPATMHIRQVGDKYYVNLKAMNALFLARAGVRQIELSDACTACRTDLFWSHRRHGAARGSQGAIIVCKEAHL